MRILIFVKTVFWKMNDFFLLKYGLWKYKRNKKTNGSKPVASKFEVISFYNSKDI